MWALLVLAALAAADINTHRYKDGEEVILWTNKGNASRGVQHGAPWCACLVGAAAGLVVLC